MNSSNYEWLRTDFYFPRKLFLHVILVSVSYFSPSHSLVIARQRKLGSSRPWLGLGKNILKMSLGFMCRIFFLLLFRYFPDKLRKIKQNMVQLTEDMIVARTRVTDMAAVKKLNCW